MTKHTELPWLEALEQLVHLIWVYEFLNDFDEDDTDLADAVENAKQVIAKAKEGK